MKFEDALKQVLKHEGGWVNHPRDPGGETNLGISKRSFPYLDIKNLTQKDVEPIYKANYWDAIKGDELPPYMRLIVFDAAVNQGVSAAGAMLQGALGLPIDGVIGPKTIHMVHTIDKLKMLEKYAQFRFIRYSENRRWQDFGKGWTKRLNDIVFRSFETLRG